MLEITIHNKFMGSKHNTILRIDNERMFIKTKHMDIFEEVTLFNLSEFQILNKSVVDCIDKHYRFSNNLFQYIQARIYNFNIHKGFNEFTFYLIDNFVEAIPMKRKTFVFNIKETAKNSKIKYNSIFNEYVLLIEEI